MRFALWSADNTTLTSSLFYVPPRKCVLLSAVNFAEFKFSQESSFRTKQCVCVERLLYDLLPEQLGIPKCGCDWVFEPVRPLAAEVGVLSASTNGCFWTLDSCDNLRIIGLPGTYRLRLNDSTAIGTAQVFAEQFDYAQLPPQISGLFFH